MVDHWYQLHIKTTNNSLSGAYQPDAQGPLTDVAMLARVQEIVEAKPEPGNQVPHFARITRVDVGKATLYKKTRAGWVSVNEFSTLPNLPARVSKLFPRPDTPLRGLLLLSAFDLQDMTAWQFVEESAPVDPSVLLAGFPYNQCLIVEAAVTPFREIGADLDVVCQRLGSTPFLDTHPESEGSFRNPVEEMEGRPAAGFRSWRLQVPSVIAGDEILDAEPRLYGPHYWPDDRMGIYEWRDAEKTAVCKKGGHPVPDPDCGCGLYAHYELDSAINDHTSGPDMSVNTIVWGAVLGAGDVLLHDGGWRSQYARIIGFDGDHVDERFRPALVQLAAKWEVPVLSSERLVRLAMRKGRKLRKIEEESPNLD